MSIYPLPIPDKAEYVYATDSIIIVHRDPRSFQRYYSLAIEQMKLVDELYEKGKIKTKDLKFAEIMGLIALWGALLAEKTGEEKALNLLLGAVLAAISAHKEAKRRGIKLAKEE